MVNGEEVVMIHDTSVSGCIGEANRLLAKLDHLCREFRSMSPGEGQQRVTHTQHQYTPGQGVTYVRYDRRGFIYPVWNC